MNETHKTLFPRRPPRLSRIFSDLQPFYLITINTYYRKHLLNHPSVHDSFIRFCETAKTKNVAVGRYVLMPDHIHLFVMIPPDGIKLSQWVQSMKSVLGKELLKLGSPKPHWQEGFFDHLLRTAESYAEKWEYFRQNPVRAELCKDPESWPFKGEIEPIRF